MPRRPPLLSAFSSVVLFTLLAGDAVRYTIGWIGYGVLVAALALIAVVILVRRRHSIIWQDVPPPMVAFLGLALLSTAWSAYPGWTALGALVSIITAIAGVTIAATRSWRELLRDLGIVLRVILGLSLAFELFVAWIIRHPILPIASQPGVDYSNLPDRIPLMWFWSRNQLFDDGKIQGIVGNSVILAFIATLAIVVFAIQLADRTVHRVAGLVWLGVAVGVFTMTRSATMVVALAAVVAVAAVILLLRRQQGRARVIGSAAVFAVIVVGVVVALALRDALLGLLGKSPDLTNRTEIWDAVIGLASERPVQGLGWLGYWVPTIEPFAGLAENNGVQQLHAHNAWLDVWLQLGILGLIAFGFWVLSTLARSWNIALDRPAGREVRAHTALSLLPLLLLVLLLVQSVAESRLLIEAGFALLVILSMKAKADPVPEVTDARQA
jgi:exopolysaccharide production protein ExoQ